MLWWCTVRQHCMQKLSPQRREEKLLMGCSNWASLEKMAQWWPTGRKGRDGWVGVGGGAGPWCADDKQPSVTVASPPRRPAPVSSHSEPAGTPPAWLYITSPWLLLLLLFGDLLRGQTSLPTPQTAVVKLPGGCVHSEQCSSARFAFYARTAQTHGHAETWVGCCVWGVVCEVLCVPYRFLISRF